MGALPFILCSLGCLLVLVGMVIAAVRNGKWSEWDDAKRSRYKTIAAALAVSGLLLQVLAPVLAFGVSALRSRASH